MSALRIDTTTNLKSFKKFYENIPRTFVSYLSSVAKKGRLLLRKDLLSGQALNLKSGDTDVRGKHMVTGRVAKAFTIVFASYPANLFERGRTLRSGERETGKYIITKQFKSLLDANLQKFSESSLNRTLEKEASKV